MNENIVPFKSCSKAVLLILGIVLMGWGMLFSMLLILNGAWPVSIFLGIEYVLIIYLIRIYLRENNIKEEIKIDNEVVSIKKFKGNKLLHTSKYGTYWSKVFFTRFKNKSKLYIRESNKETEVATFLHADLKESLYKRISRQINIYP
ncbi:DUF2244 domain-containing protein [Pelagibacteraceae bacterium]|nr:DUF2244 domain-containing protein [Pelagibacteraceae bacterium]